MTVICCIVSSINIPEMKKYKPNDSNLTKIMLKND